MFLEESFARWHVSRLTGVRLHGCWRGICFSVRQFRVNRPSGVRASRGRVRGHPSGKQPGQSATASRAHLVSKLPSSEHLAIPTRGGESGPWERGQISRRLLHCRNALEGQWVLELSAGVSGGQPAQRPCQQRQDGATGTRFLLCKFRIKEAAAAARDLSLSFPVKGSRVTTGNVSLWF